MEMKMLTAIEKFKEWRQYKVGKFTLRGYDGQLRQLCIFLKDPDIEDISYENVMEWIILNERVGYSNNAIMPKCEALKQFLKFYKKLGHNVLDPEIIPIPRKEFKHPRTTNIDEYTKLLKAADILEENTIKRGYFSDQISIWRNRALLGLLWDTGARLGEILDLNIKDLDFRGNKAVIRTEKSRGRRPFREIFWTKSTTDLLKKWLEGRTEYFIKHQHDEDAIFLNLKGRWLGRRISNSGVHAFLKFWSHTGKISRTVNAHSFRHHKGHDIINKGGSAADVMNILGHANVTSSQPYMSMNDKELQDRADKFLD